MTDPIIVAKDVGSCKPHSIVEDTDGLFIYRYTQIITQFQFKCCEGKESSACLRSGEI